MHDGMTALYLSQRPSYPPRPGSVHGRITWMQRAPWMPCNYLASMMRISALLANHFGAAGLLRQVRVTGWPLSPGRVSVT